MFLTVIMLISILLKKMKKNSLNFLDVSVTNMYRNWYRKPSNSGRLLKFYPIKQKISVAYNLTDYLILYFIITLKSLILFYQLIPIHKIL